MLKANWPVDKPVDNFVNNVSQSPGLRATAGFPGELRLERPSMRRRLVHNCEVDCRAKATACSMPKVVWGSSRWCIRFAGEPRFMQGGTEGRSEPRFDSYSGFFDRMFRPEGQGRALRRKFSGGPSGAITGQATVAAYCKLLHSFPQMVGTRSASCTTPRPPYGRAQLGANVSGVCGRYGQRRRP